MSDYISLDLTTINSIIEVSEIDTNNKAGIFLNGGHKMKQCKYCKSEIDDKAVICPHCRRGQESIYLKVIAFIVIAVLIIGLVITFKNNEDEYNNIKGIGYFDNV